MSGPDGETEEGLALATDTTSMNERVNATGEPPIRIVHPSDFSQASRVAFAHALKIAFQTQAQLEIVHVQRHRIGREKDIQWSDFPGVRATLARWNILPVEAQPDEVAKTGMRIKKILNAEKDPLDALLRYCQDHPPDLLVLATRQREGLNRLLHKAVAAPLARRSRAMTLFVPAQGRGFIAPATGRVNLRRILIPVDYDPDGQAALEEAHFFASGFDRSGVHFRLLHVGKAMPNLSLPHRPGSTWETRVVAGDPVESILAEDDAWSPDLIVMATQGHMNFLDALRGSTTERIVRGAHCAVLAVPQKPV
jgi:nucleotide-binding universal stress UspA family protein